MLQVDDVTDERRERRLVIAMGAAFSTVVALTGFDIVADMGEGASTGHVAVETVVVLVGLAGLAAAAWRIAVLVRRASALRASTRSLEDRLKRTRAEAERWRQEAREALEDLATAMDRQFERWALTPAEKEVAMLLLKGLSHKEIAEVRDVGDGTARQQARAVYRKAGVAGRADLAAFFLEDLMVPRRIEVKDPPILITDD